MDRRTFVSTAAIGYIAMARVLHAQQPNRVRRVGALIYLAEDDPE